MHYRMKPLVRLFWVIARPFVRIWMSFQMRPIFIGSFPVSIEPPYLVISNHVNVYDGLLITVNLRHLPVTIFDDIQRMNATNRFIFTNAGTVFKPFGIPDPLVVRNMIKARDAGRSMLLYPEGEITWNGESKPLEPSLARLIRLLDIPVILIKVKGGFAKQPKWARKFRSGRCVLEYRLILTRDDIRKLDDASLLETLSKAHAHSEQDWLATEEGLSCDIRTQEPANGLNALLYCCPSCKSVNSMKTDGRKRIICGNCGLTAKVDASFNLAGSDDLPFSDVRSWHLWQTDFWTARAKELSSSDDPILKAESPEVKSGPVNGFKMTACGKGPVILYRDRIEYIGPDGKGRTLPISSIRMCHCYRMTPGQENRLLMRTEDEYLLFRLDEPNSPSLSWEVAIKGLTQKQAHP